MFETGVQLRKFKGHVTQVQIDAQEREEAEGRTI